MPLPACCIRHTILPPTAGQNEPGPGVSLERDIGTPPSYDWSAAIAKVQDPLMDPIFNILKQFNVPAASIAYLVNPSSKSIPHQGPVKGRSGHLWLSYGFGVAHDAVMRVASVSKPLTYAVWVNDLPTFTSQGFYDLWTE